MSKFKPMLSGKIPKNLNHLRYPVYASEKIDGIRCVMQRGDALSRTFKLIPNRYIQHCLKHLPDGLDGELVVGDIHHPDVFNISQSGIMSEDGAPDFTFYVFDMVSNLPFKNRWQCANSAITSNTESTKYCKLVMHYEIENAINLQKCADYYVGLGAEGIMVRDPNGKYKYGRSTEKEGGLLKYKPFLDGEAIIIDFVEQMHNDNEPELDALGLMKRSKHQANLSAAGKLGAFICQFADMSKPDIVFNVGTGFTDAQRIEYWNNRSKYLGKIFNFKYQNLTAENKPRIPSFKGFRLD